MRLTGADAARGGVALLAVLVIGSLYHRVMGLPVESREQGRKVLGELPDLAGVILGRRGRARATTRKLRPGKREVKLPSNSARSSAPVCSSTASLRRRMGHGRRRDQIKAASRGLANWVCAIRSWYDRWYQRRSDLVHGTAIEIDPDEVQHATHWLVGYTLPEILKWLISHPDDPIGDLEDAVDGLPRSSSSPSTR